MVKFLRLVLVSLALGTVSDMANAACPTFHTLSNGTTADAAEVMDNFTYILQCPTIVQTVSATHPSLDIRVDNGSGTSAPVFTVNAATSYANVQATMPASRSLLSVGTFGDSSGIGYSAVFRGNVGLGTITPGSKLTILQSVSAASPDIDIRVDDGSGNSASVLTVNAATSYSNVQATLPASRSLLSVGTFGDGAGIGYSAVFRGNVGIGTAIPGQKLDVIGTIRQSNCTTAGTLSTNTSGDIICTSDARLKNVLGNYTDGLYAISQITPQRFTYKPTASNPVETFVHAGFIAQNVRSAIPEAVAVQRNGYLSLDTTAVLAASVNAIKELKAANDSQASEIAQLRAQNLAVLGALQKANGRLDALEREPVIRATENSTTGRPNTRKQGA